MNENDWIGKSLAGRYHIEELLGQGGMSAVYKAQDPNLKRVVAVKMIHSHLSSDPGFVSRFEEEATSIAQLRHPNIVQVYDFNVEDEIYYMVMEFIPGETLQDHLKRLNDVDRRMPLEDVVNYMVNVCEAADYAHDRGMIHRDIKPANVMLSVFEQAILMDFGIAKIIGGQQHTATGAVVGTALYMSPEQIKGQQIDRRSDIYSLGVTLFEMVSGRPPFKADSAMTLMMMHVNDPVPNLQDLYPDVPAEMVAVINKALDKKPENRFQNAGEMATALNNLIGKPAVAPPVTESDSLGATIVEDSQPELEVPEATALAAAAASTTVDPKVEVPEETVLAAAAAETAAEPEAEVQEETALAAAAAAATTIEPEQIVQEALPEAQEASAAPASAPTPPSKAEESTGLPVIGNIKPLYLAIGGGVILLIVIGIIFGGSLFSGSSPGGDGGEGVPIAGASPTENPEVVAVLDTEAPTITPTETATLAPPTETPTPTTVPTSTQIPTETVPPGIPFTRITDITINDQNRYEIAYETFEFTEEISSTTLHVHFFFNTVPPENAGVPGSGPWILYGGPRPFTGYAPADRPAEATQMCILVANPDHSIQMNSGNCFDLPDVMGATIVDDSGASMGLVPGGVFQMGTSDGPVTEQPIHEQDVEDFYIDLYEVTNAQYSACVSAGACNPLAVNSSLTRAEYYGYPSYENYPVVNITWNDASAFCTWRGARLPIEAEWAKAARDEDLRTHPWGEDPMTCDMANVNNCTGDTTAVGSYPNDVSPYGMYDMAGNVREMTADWFSAYPGGDTAGNPYYGETHRTTRGGTFDQDWLVSSRGFVAPEDVFPQIGFRCAKSP